MAEFEQPLDKKMVRQLVHKLTTLERRDRFLIKDRSSERAALEEVFDKSTLMVLYHLMNSNVFRYLHGVVDSGKEARIYRGEREDGSSVAVKIFLVTTAEFKKRLPYIMGDPRFNKVKKGMKNIVELWARKEYKNLVTAFNAGIRVPQPIAVMKNVLVMEFIGEDNHPAPLLNEVEVTKTDYKKVISIIKNMYRKAKLVHADLSEYNIFKWHGKLIIFDLGSAVDLGHPSAHQFLMRDIFNINRFFMKRGIDVESESILFKKVVGNEF